ncbi:MAG: preprotein translocase subunit SecE [Mangrovicoccus sp.]
MAMTNPMQFIQQVRGEVAKIVWPTKQETLITTVMVLIMATVAAIFFFFVDWIIRSGLQAVLTFFGS